MQVQVSRDYVKITDYDYEVHKGEYRASEVEYTFSEEYEGLTCKAIFNDKKDNTIEVPITVGKSIIPYEILSSGASECELRVYGYETEEVEENGETTTKLKLRYSPAYDLFPIKRGSYIPDAASTEEITPTQFEQYTEALNEGLNDIQEGLGDIATAVENAGRLDVDATKENKTTTITITKQDGTQTTTLIEDGIDGQDGADFEYNWVGTSLGVKTSEESDYQYVNLKGDTGEAGQIEFIVVNELPQEGVEGTIYLVPLEEPDTQGNNYAEYIWVNNAWELLGKIGVSVDLSGYYTKTETDNLLTNKVGFTDYADDGVVGAVKTNKNTYGIGTVNGTITPMYTTYSSYTSKGNSYAIAKGTLENVITGKGLINNTVNNLVNYTTTTDMNTALGNKEDKSNKVTSISSSSTDTQYPSAKCVYDIVGDIASALDTINGENI